MNGTDAQLSLAAWLGFGAIVVALLVVDLVTTTGERADSRRWMLGWSIVWIGTGLAFTGAVWYLLDASASFEYLTVFLLEKSLSLDNLFVFLVIFTSLNIPHRFQHEVLFWGIVGAAVFRALFIFAGAAALSHFEWVVFLFAAILLYGAWHTLREDPSEQREPRALRWLSQRLPVSEGMHEGKFIARRSGKLVVTALGVALCAIEASDIVFAIDSVAAALSITRNEFVIYSANIFAILGLRALYLLLANLIGDWPYLHYGIAAVLAFTAVKLMLEPFYKIPVWASLLVIIGAITVSIVASIRANRARANRSES